MAVNDDDKMVNKSKKFDNHTRQQHQRMPINSTQPGSILVVEDDLRLGEMLALHLEKYCHSVDVAESGRLALEKIELHDYHLVILDRNLPDLDGLEVCRRIRKANSEIRILMLTALTEELDFIVGLESGADDYVGKPFRVGELLARVHVLLRRAVRLEGNVACKNLSFEVENTCGSRGSETTTSTMLNLDLDKRRVHLANNEISLTAREFDLLAFLAKSPGRAYTREQILEHVWGTQTHGYEHSINTIVKRIRKKLGADASSNAIIETVRGIGYRFAETVS